MAEHRSEIKEQLAFISTLLSQASIHWIELFVSIKGAQSDINSQSSDYQIFLNEAYIVLLCYSSFSILNTHPQIMFLHSTTTSSFQQTSSEIKF